MTTTKWKTIPLHKVAEIRTGIAKGKRGIKNPVSVPYLMIANVQDGAIDFSVIKTIEIEESQLQRYALQNGDVLMTEGGDFDKLGRGDVWQGEISLCLHQNHVFAVRPNTAMLNPYFLAALSSSFYGKTYFLSCAKRSTNLASINSTQIKIIFKYPHFPRVSARTPRRNRTRLRSIALQKMISVSSPMLSFEPRSQNTKPAEQISRLCGFAK